ncbi:MAG: chemotaxis protein CheW [bacterium]|nr:chemotaxis protein CheW [bacterium]
MSLEAIDATEFEQGLACFRLGEGLFAVDLKIVAEINPHLEITPARTAPSYVSGLVNLRGQIVTVVDLASKIGLEAAPITTDSRLLVLKTDAELQRTHSGELSTSPDKVGLLVDSIADVVTPENDQLEPPPPNLNGIARNLLWGVCKTKTDTIGILDAEKILATEETEA